MQAPQIILIVFTAISFLTYLRGHGKPKTGNYNLFYWTIAACIEYALLIWGGFFN
jgi:hypothetical protein